MYTLTKQPANVWVSSAQGQWPPESTQLVEEESQDARQSPREGMKKDLEVIISSILQSISFDPYLNQS